MKLLTKEILKKVPPLYAQEKKGNDAIVYAKFFDPCGSWTWFMTEYNPETGIAFGLVKGLDTELGYFSIPELEAYQGRFGLGIERDLYFAPKTLAEIKVGVAS